MSEIQKILCPVDFSDSSDRALDYALDFAARVGAEVHVLHAYQLPIYALPDGAAMPGPELAARVSVELQRSLDEIEARETKVEVQTHLCEGLPHKEVQRLAEELGCDLVVIGTHGRTGLAHFLIGSVAERVVRTSPVPVITVPMKGEPK